MQLCAFVTSSRVAYQFARTLDQDGGRLLRLFGLKFMG